MCNSMWSAYGGCAVEVCYVGLGLMIQEALCVVRVGLFLCGTDSMKQGEQWRRIDGAMLWSTEWPTTQSRMFAFSTNEAQCH